MKTKILLSLVLPIFLLAIFAGGALGAKRSRVPLIVPHVDGAGSAESYGPRSPVRYEGFTQPDCENINPDLPYGEYVIQHYQHGVTWYEYQKNGSVGRMISADAAGNRNMVFHRSDGVYPPGPRYVCYNCKDPWDVWCCAPECMDGECNAGYANVDHMRDGRALVLYHHTAPCEDGQPIWYSTLRIQSEGDVCTPYFGFSCDLPDYFTGRDAQGMWPKMCVVPVGDTDYMHIVMTEGDPPGVNRYLGYIRCRETAENTLLCETPDNGQQGVVTPVTVNCGENGCGQFCPIAYFGQAEASFCPDCGPDDYPNNIAIVAVSSPVSRKVAIVFVNKKVSGDAQWNNDVFYTESDSNGYEWFPQFAPPGIWPPTVANGMLVNVTQYPADYPERAYTEVQACYDYEDNLHIVWTSCQYDPATGQPQTFDANLMHWKNSDAPGINNASIAVPGYWDDGTYSCGAWNRNISKFSISAKPLEYHPDSVFLFCTWTQFRPMDSDPPDQSADDFANGDIYGNVSQDGGQTWSRGYNLTGTKTPECDPNLDDPCLSEHWSSLAEYMYNGDLHIQYICDRDAGGAIQDAPSIWTENPVMYLHFKQLPTVAACDVNIQLTDPPTSWCYPPLKVLPGQTRSIIMKLRGLYTLAGDYSVTTNNPNVVCNTNCSGRLDPQEEEMVELLINCPGGESFIAAKVFVDYCVGTEDAATETVHVHVVQSYDYYECPRDTLRTTIWKDNCKLRAWFCANCEQRVWDKRLLDPDEDEIQPIFSAGPIVATTWAGDTLVGRQDYDKVLTGARDTIHFVAGIDPDQPECSLQVVWSKNTFICAWPLPIPTHQRWWWIDIHKQIFMWHDSLPGVVECPNWKKEQIIKQIRITLSFAPGWWPSPGAIAYEDIWFGYFADVDAPFDDGGNGYNTAGYEPSHEMVWFHGWMNDTLPPEEQHPEYEEYYVGLKFTDRDGNVVTPLGVQVVRNDSFLYPQDGWGWKEGELYELAATPGVNIQDEAHDTLDRSVVMTASHIPGGTGDFSAEFILIEAFIPTGLQDLIDHMIYTQETLVPHLRDLGVFDQCPICGDVNEDGTLNSADIVTLINYLFKGGPPPSWPINRGDVNGDYKVDAADIVYLINYLFTGGARPYCSGFGRYFSPPSWGQDPLDPDTVYLRVEDCKVTPRGTDIPVTIWFSNDEDLELILTPFCWIGDAYLNPDKNSFDSLSEYYIFRNYNGIPNRVEPYFLDSLWWVFFHVDSLNNKLLLCMYSELSSINLPPGSGLFATLIFTCDQPTAPLIDTCFSPPSHHLMFVEPNNNYFVPQFRSWDPVDCNTSYTDDCLTFCPLGDIDFKATLLDNKNDPVVGYSNVWLDFTNCSGIIRCPSYHPQWPKVFPEGPSDDNGRVYFRVHAGGNSESSVKVIAGCGQIGEVSFPKSVDVSGNLLVEPSDFDESYGNKRDFNCDGIVDWRDDDIFKDHINHGCTFNPCLFLQQTISINPDTTLVPGDSIDVTWRLENLNSFDTCYIEKVELYYTNFSGSAGLIKFHTEYWNSNLPPRGNIQLTVHNFITPDLPNMCIIARTYTDCCTPYAEAKNCWDIKRLCPPDAITYSFFMYNIIPPLQIDTTLIGPVATGEWSYSIQWNMPDSVRVEITTDDESPMGTKGGVTLWFKYDNVWEDKNFEVIFTLNSGDANSDCVVNSADVVYLINYLFKYGPPPDPLRGGDVNCDCVINSADVVYLIDYLFKGGPPPVSSETCECGY